MKTQLNKLRSAMRLLCMAVIMFCTLGAYAQTIYYPSTTEVSPANPGSIVWLNNANIERVIPVFPFPRVGIYATTWDANAGTIRFRLATSAGTTSAIQAFTAPPGYVSIYSPDIALGNDALGNFYVVVVYTAVDAGGNTNIFSNAYQIATYSPITFAGPNVVQLTNTNDVGNSHIDAISRETNVPSLTVYDFVVAWETMTCTVGGNMGAASLLWNFTDAFNNVVATINTSGCINVAVDGAMVDVAGIERANGFGTDEIGLYCYMDLGTGDMYYNEYNFTFPGAPVETYQDGNGRGNIEYPRIDAIDPYTQNTNAADALYDIAYRYYFTGSTSNWTVKQANNLNTPNPADIPTNDWTGTSGADNYSPVVAAYPKDFYDLAYASPQLSYTCCGGTTYTNQYAVLSEGIDILNGSGNAGNVYPSNSNPDIYIVNWNAGGTYPVAVSNSWDYISAQSRSVRELICWYNPAGGGTVDCKAVSGGWTYKPADVNESTMIHMTGDTYPNPAGEILNIKTEAKDPVKYAITDVLGRVQQRGELKNGERRINVDGLASGMYILHVQDGQSSRDMKFMKQ